MFGKIFTIVLIEAWHKCGLVSYLGFLGGERKLVWLFFKYLWCERKVYTLVQKKNIRLMKKVINSHCKNHVFFYPSKN